MPLYCAAFGQRKPLLFNLFRLPVPNKRQPENQQGVPMNNTLLAAAALGLALTACSPVSPRAPQTAPAQTQPQSAAERNKANALAFYELAFNQHDLQRAVRQYVGKEYLQHNPMVADGGQAFIDAFAPFLKQNPQSRASVKRVIADGDLVALHVHSQLSPDDAGEAVVDIFRSDNDGKIVEHWDVIQPVPKEKTASGRSMF
ncbi:SnoaL-like polyketide cyclase [Kingella oralis ATCC 51147]|uniref:SnoaL-like polyketide cyclase n=2 Tax=Kingella TaxID=32257 RepID=C4GMT0_9NEIS|nr:SnoaL-like polyketide cyclase [Kingella oralis ATCC 51147]